MERSDHIAVQLLRYSFVAIVAFVIDFGLLYLFTQYFLIYYLLSATLSFLISLLFNYLLSKYWAFVGNEGRSRMIEISGFLLIGLVGLILNDIIIFASTQILGVYYLYSKLIAIVIVFFWSFLSRRYIIFYKKTIKSSP